MHYLDRERRNTTARRRAPPHGGRWCGAVRYDGIDYTEEFTDRLVPEIVRRAGEPGPGSRRAENDEALRFADASPAPKLRGWDSNPQPFG